MQLIKTRWKLSKLKSDLVLMFLSALALYAGLTTQHKSWFDWVGIACSLFSLFYLPYLYLRPRLKGKKKKTSYIQGDTLNIDMKGKDLFDTIVAFTIIGLDILFLYKFHSIPAILVFLLVLLGAHMYGSKDITLGIYKNGKYLGTIYKGLIKVGDNLAVGERKDIERIGSLKILKDGKEVAKLYLTLDGFMELKPEKISEVFPEIKGNIERFRNLFKVGDYTLEYSLSQNNTSYEYAYENTHKVFGDDFLDPANSFLPYNVFHND